MKKKLYPLMFAPVYKDYPWGGVRIPETYNRSVPAGIYAESWEISDRADGMSVVTNGEWAGTSFEDLLRKYPLDIMGSYARGTRFPLLIKLIDSKQKLSVQVHPDDNTASLYGGEAKTEMWYLLGDNSTQVYCGLKDEVTKESFISSVANRTSSEALRSVPVEQGSAIYVKGGRVHAIDAGCLLLEIQQNSNTTYRIYDWDRVDADGVSRTLHLDEALDVISWDDHEDPKVSPRLLAKTDSLDHQDVLTCKYFRLERISFSEPVETLLDGTTFHALFIAKGACWLQWGDELFEVSAGESILIPASLSSYTLRGVAVVLRTSLPCVQCQLDE